MKTTHTLFQREVKESNTNFSKLINDSWVPKPHEEKKKGVGTDKEGCVERALCVLPSPSGWGENVFSSPQAQVKGL